MIENGRRVARRKKKKKKASDVLGPSADMPNLGLTPDSDAKTNRKFSDLHVRLD
jgi:hypothetical protein